MNGGGEPVPSLLPAELGYSSGAASLSSFPQILAGAALQAQCWRRCPEDSGSRNPTPSSASDT